MIFKITWLSNGFVQYKQLVTCRRKEGFFLMNSAIYEAIEDESFCIDLGYGKHYFKAEQL